MGLYSPPTAARGGACQCDGQPDGSRGAAAAHGGHSMWPETPPSAPRRDAVYGRHFRNRARRIGIDAIATPIHAPNANAIAERVIGALRRECLDHVIVIDEQHLQLERRKSADRGRRSAAQAGATEGCCRTQLLTTKVTTISG